MLNFNFFDPGRQFLLLQRLAKVPQKLFLLVQNKMHVMRINSSIEVFYIWTIAGYLSCGYPWLLLDILGYRWLSFVITSYPWLSQVTT